jgi:uncharacterized protein involved in type VI secretion and phage assembly
MSFTGVYKARVRSTADPDQLGRVQVEVPEVSGRHPVPVWAYPTNSAPGGKNYGGYWPPRTGDIVAVAFDGGDPSCPRVLGGWHAKGELPGEFKDGDKRGFKTPGGHVLLWDDANPGAFILRTAGGHEIAMADTSGGTLTVKHLGGQTIAIEANSTIHIGTSGCPTVDVGVTGTTVNLAGGGQGVVVKGMACVLGAPLVHLTGCAFVKAPTTEGG